MTSTDERKTRRFIRTLYVLAVMVNTWYAIELAKETDEGRAALGRMKDQALRVKNRAASTLLLWHSKTFFKDHADDMIKEAEAIVGEEE